MPSYYYQIVLPDKNIETFNTKKELSEYLECSTKTLYNIITHKNGECEKGKIFKIKKRTGCFCQKYYDPKVLEKIDPEFRSNVKKMLSKCSELELKALFTLLIH